MDVIIVDDELSSLNTFLANIVDETDVKCSMFMNNPVGALEFAQSNEVSGAFLDINMPKINGIDLATQLLEVKPNLKIVFISGYEQNEQTLKEHFGKSLLGFCNKPYDDETLKRYIYALKSFSATPQIYFKTFPTFDIFLNGKPLFFSRTKSKELLALLVDRRGSTVAIGEAVACLWGDKAQNLSKRLYRDATSRLRLVLAENGITHLVNFGRGQLSLNCDGTQCDMWTYLDNENDTNYMGEYMTSYEWNEEKQYALDELKQKRANMK